MTPSGGRLPRQPAGRGFAVCRGRFARQTAVQVAPGFARRQCSLIGRAGRPKAEKAPDRQAGVAVAHGLQQGGDDAEG